MLPTATIASVYGLYMNPTEKGPAIFRLKAHLERFLRSLDLVGLPLELSFDEIAAAILEALRANPGATNVKVCAYIPSIEVEVVPMDARVSLAVAADLGTIREGVQHIASTG